jgi:hypothetical protein
VAQLVESLHYKPEDRGFDFRWCKWNFSLTQSFRPHYCVGVHSASNRNEYQKYFLGRWRWPVRRADNLTIFMCQLSWNLGTSNSWKPQGLSRSVKGLLYLILKPRWIGSLKYVVICGISRILQISLQNIFLTRVDLGFRSCIISAWRWLKYGRNV